MTKPLNRSSANLNQRRPVKVLQFGEGNFLRAFCDWMIDILNEKASFNSDVQVVQPIAQGMGAMLNAQDGLYHVVLNGIQRGEKKVETRLISCLRSVLNPYEDYQQFLALTENPDLRFVISNTTEAGISFSDTDKSHETLPNSFPGKVTALLYHRYQYFKGAKDKGLIFLPCELIEKNGTNLKLIVDRYSSMWNLPDSFMQWVATSCVFCNTLVDRIVPGFPKETIKSIQQEAGYEDNLVVMAEPFHLWVIEGPDHVLNDIPFAKAGLNVILVKDLTPYRTRKVRILNGAHTAMVPVAYLRGLRTVRESIEDQYVGQFISDALHQEIIPTLDLPKEELERFADEVMERFQNPYIRHELSSIALNSVSKFKVRVLPSLISYFELTGKLPERLLTSLAALIRFYKGEWHGERLPVSDTPDILSFFADTWKSNDPKAVVERVLANTDFWGEDLSKRKGFVDFVSTELKKLG